MSRFERLVNGILDDMEKQQRVEREADFREGPEPLRFEFGRCMTREGYPSPPYQYR